VQLGIRGGGGGAKEDEKGDEPEGKELDREAAVS
jgi:hypothetical protein